MEILKELFFSLNLFFENHFFIAVLCSIILAFLPYWYLGKLAIDCTLKDKEVFNDEGEH